MSLIVNQVNDFDEILELVSQVEELITNIKEKISNLQ